MPPRFLRLSFLSNTYYVRYLRITLLALLHFYTLYALVLFQKRSDATVPRQCPFFLRYFIASNSLWSAALKLKIPALPFELHVRMEALCSHDSGLPSPTRHTRHTRHQIPSQKKKNQKKKLKDLTVEPAYLPTYLPTYLPNDPALLGASQPSFKHMCAHTNSSYFPGYLHSVLV